jgi:hypothetical protein
VPLLRAEINPEYEDDEKEKWHWSRWYHVLHRERDRAQCKVSEGDVTSCPGSVTEHKNAWWCHVQEALERAEHVA